MRQKLLSARDLIVTAGPFALLSVALLVAAFWLIDPAPPAKIIIATGPDNGDYYALAKRYQSMLAVHGIKAELKVTQGSRENLALLLAPGEHVSVAFMRSGTTLGEDADIGSLTSIGSLFYEPVWMFYRDKLNLNSLTDLKGLRVELGAAGNGSGKIVDSLLKENGLSRTDIQASENEATQAVIGLLDGQVDALFMISAPESQLVQMLLRTPGLRLMPFPQAQAFSRKLPNLSAVALPRGMIDFAGNLPPLDIPMVAATATLVHNNTAHPAVVDLLIQSAHAIHSQASWFADARKFPSVEATELPISKEAARFYTSGPPLLQRYLPFWLANLVERMWVVLLSLGALLIPLSRILPPIYQWRIRSRIYRWYGQLRDVERQTLPGTMARSARLDQDMFEKLDDIEARVNEINIPLSHAEELYQLRAHIALVRKKLTQPSQSRTPNAAARPLEQQAVSK